MGLAHRPGSAEKTMRDQTGNLRLLRAQAALAPLRLRVDALAEALLRRSRLARQPRPDGISGPSPYLLVGELNSLARRVVGMSDFGNALRPQPVMLIPGFFSHPRRMRPMALALAQAGHKVENWGLGFNMGPTPENFGYLERRVARLARQHGVPIALVGWSLGGLFAREIAHRQPENVSRVITMGTPFSGDPRANNAWRAYQTVTGHDVETPPIKLAAATKPPVPTIALWSPRDGVISARSAAGWPGERDRAVAVRCTHIGFSNHPAAIGEVLRQLDLRD